MEERLLRFPEVIKMSGLSRMTITRREEEGKFPKRIKLSDRIVAWKLSDVQKWIKQQTGDKK